MLEDIVSPRPARPLAGSPLDLLSDAEHERLVAAIARLVRSAAKHDRRALASGGERGDSVEPEEPRSN